MSMETSAHSRTVTVSVPATSANLGPGFDCLGLALELRNDVTLTATGLDLAYDDPRPTRYDIAVTGCDADKVPTDGRNLLIEAAGEGKSDPVRGAMKDAKSTDGDYNDEYRKAIGDAWKSTPVKEG